MKEIDDHADYIGVEMTNDCSIRNGGGHKQVTRRMCFSRFWKLEDDGVYLITLNSMKFDDYPASVMVYCKHYIAYVSLCFSLGGKEKGEEYNGAFSGCCDHHRSS